MSDGPIPFERPRRPRRPRQAPGSGRAAHGREARQQGRDRRLSPQPVPARITLALDTRGLSGDQVDRDLGVWTPPAGWVGPVWEPGTAVDQWEAGTLVPTRGQITALAMLTGFPWRFFYLPVENIPDRVLICERGRGLTVVRSEVDHNGVLRIYGSDDGRDVDDPDTKPPRPAPAKARKATAGPGVHRFEPEPNVPGVCRVCGFPKPNRRHEWR
jgi:hypothetical protein